jgi:nicotinamidase-related amidase
MPLVPAGDSVLVVVDAQAGFISGGVMDAGAEAIASGTVERIAWLADTGRRTVVLTGFETDTCVAQSGVVLRDLGYRVIVPRDATYSSGDTEHERGLERLLGAGAETNSCKGVTFEWLEHVGTALDVFPRARRDFDVLPWRL